MAAVTIAPSTGCLVIDGAKVFPIGLAQPPPVGGKTPSGSDAWKEIAGARVNFIRTRAIPWSLAQIDAQIADARAILDAATTNHLHAWLQLGEIANLPAAAGSQNEQLLKRVANRVKDHSALGVYKGVDEPANPNRPAPVPPDGLIRAFQKLHATDPDHPLVIT